MLILVVAKAYGSRTEIAHAYGQFYSLTLSVKNLLALMCHAYGGLLLNDRDNTYVR